MSAINLTPANPLGLLQSFMSVEHAVPEGWQIVELKACENCSRSFVRRVCSGLKFYGPCRSHMLMPENFDKYKEILITEQFPIRLSVPCYDDSLAQEAQ